MNRSKEDTNIELVQATIDDKRNHESYHCAKGLADYLMKAIMDYYMSISKYSGEMQICAANDYFFDTLVSWRSERDKRLQENRALRAIGKKPKPRNIPDDVIDSIFSAFDRGGYFGNTYVSPAYDSPRTIERVRREMEEEEKEHGECDD